MDRVKEKKKNLRFLLALVYVIATPMTWMAEPSSLGNGLFLLWLVVLLALYRVIIEGSRCPSCKAEFSMEKSEKTLFTITTVCRECGMKHTVWRGGGGGGGAP